MSGDFGQDNSAKEMAAAAMDNEKKQELKKSASAYLESLHLINNRESKDSFISRAKELANNNDQELLKKLFLDKEEEINVVIGLYNFLITHEESLSRCKHDLGTVANGVDGILPQIFDDIKEGEDIDIDFLNMFFYVWDRYFVAVEDTLLRLVSKEQVPPEFQKGVDVDVMKGALNYFNTQELDDIKTFSGKNDSAYKSINQIKIELISNEEWDKIKNELGDRQIVGDNGLVGNFELNALRNALKDRVEANAVTQTVEIKEDWFVIRVVDNGKGIRLKFLQKDYKEIDEATGEEKEIYIFHEGASGTGSTGKGLADFDTRLASVGGELYVITKTVSDGIVRFQYGSTSEKANKVEFDESLDHGTVFEIRLPIIQK